MEENKITYEMRGDVALIRLNDPATLNSLTAEIEWDFCGMLDRAEREARCALLTGNGRGFCSGGNLSPGGPMDLAPGARDLGSGIEKNVIPMMMRIRNLGIPFITAVNGVAAGAGCSLALMGDIIIASESVNFVLTFSRIGLVPDGGATAMLSRTIGRVRAMELMMLGEKISAAKALEWGLINQIAPDEELFETALALAERLARGPTHSLALIRNLVWTGCEEPYEAQLWHERKAQRSAGRSADFDEGTAAFREKRPPLFHGKP